MMATPKTSVLCCTAAPFILEFDTPASCSRISADPGQGYQWPHRPAASR
jgi:hypothetical protein